MTKRQETRSRARRSVTTAIVAAALATAGMQAPAEAAVPAAAQSWTSLMYRSLTVTATGAQLRQTLATQRTTVTTRTVEVTRATAALSVAAKQVTAATNADKTAKDRVTAARAAVTAARKKLSKVKPRHKSAVTIARNGVTAAQKTLTVRTTQARDAATALAQARSSSSAATAALDTANNSVKSASAAVVLTEQKIAALKTPAELAGQAAAVSRSVVTAVRPAFTTADTVVIYGTTVHRTVSYAYRRMVDDAKKAGIDISGGGFRTKQRQIELRKINGCPDIYTAPSSSCRVPTAVPGRSLHEIGLAVDVTSGGKTLTSKSPAFKWLQLHADEYGFVNLPSEPWHWSITGG
ncbi:M15 family metallopeptidase [Actinoplanes sp. NPDC048988]|uniref:M15 family metallopeptidase n=1 Tax=Actinoplanes sp. NPDC048988 TaxID=3363901 RepID=UPI003714A42E